MSTPAAKEETLEHIAERIAKTYAPSHTARAHLRQVVLSALRNEREACAKVAEKFRVGEPGNRLATIEAQDNTAIGIAAAIRERTE